MCILGFGGGGFVLFVFVVVFLEGGGGGGSHLKALCVVPVKQCPHNTGLTKCLLTLSVSERNCIYSQNQLVNKFVIQ